ncbi:hypothetical protein D9M68_824820 [compost metagenome]
MPCLTATQFDPPKKPQTQIFELTQQPRELKKTGGQQQPPTKSSKTRLGESETPFFCSSFQNDRKLAESIK